MIDAEPTPGLPRLHTVEEVARALRCSENYVRQKARGKEWPHVRMARGAPFFTAADVARIIELHSEVAVEPPSWGLALAPRSASRRRRRLLP